MHERRTDDDALTSQWLAWTDSLARQGLSPDAGDAAAGADALARLGDMADRLRRRSVRSVERLDRAGSL